MLSVSPQGTLLTSQAENTAARDSAAKTATVDAIASAAAVFMSIFIFSLGMAGPILVAATLQLCS